jgi:predicted phage baseplate assembly protein
VIFGDGMRGARLPTGQENVKATYRAGLGPDGMVAAGALTLLQTKPLGIREVVNPVAADGAAAPEALEDARAHAPLTVLTLDRIVSLKDYEDFAAAFAGVGKAQVSALWTGITHLVHLTVAAADGTPVTTSSALYANLVAAVQRLRDPATPVQVAGYALLHFKLAAQVCVDASYLRERVEQDIRAALAAKFAFAARAFGQQVTLAEVVTVIQSVAGVVAVNVTRLHYVDHVPAEGEAPAERLNAARANWDAASGRAAPAQLLLLYPGDGGVELPEMPP